MLALKSFLPFLHTIWFSPKEAPTNMLSRMGYRMHHVYSQSYLPLSSASNYLIWKKEYVPTLTITLTQLPIYVLLSFSCWLKTRKDLYSTN